MNKDYIIYYWMKDYGDGESYPQFHASEEQAEKEMEQYLEDNGYDDGEINDLRISVKNNKIYFTNLSGKLEELAPQ